MQSSYIRYRRTISTTVKHINAWMEFNSHSQWVVKFNQRIRRKARCQSVRKWINHSHGLACLSTYQWAAFRNAEIFELLKMMNSNPEQRERAWESRQQGTETMVIIRITCFFHNEANKKSAIASSLLLLWISRCRQNYDNFICVIHRDSELTESASLSKRL